MELNNKTDVSIKVKDIEYRKNDISGILNTVYLNKSYMDFDNWSINREYFVECKVNKGEIGPIKEVPKCGDEFLKNSDENGIIKVGCNVKGGDILVGKIRKKNPREYDAEDRLLVQIFNEPLFSDCSLYCPNYIEGEVSSVDQYGGSIKITIRKKFPLEYGDILENEKGIKAVYYGRYNTGYFGAITNSATFPGEKIRRDYYQSARAMMTARDSGTYQYFNRCCPIDDGSFFSPRSICTDDIKKFIKQGLIDVLQKLIIMTRSIECRRDVYSKILIGEASDFPTYFNTDWINYIRYQLLLLGGEMIFESALISENKEDFVDENFNSPDLAIRILPISDEKIETMGMDEIEDSNTYDYKTDLPVKGGVFCEDIFGTGEQLQCACGVFLREEMARKKCFEKSICPICHEKIERLHSVRMGHICVDVEYDNPLFSWIKLSKIPVIPPDYRRVLIKSNGMYFKNSLNEFYQRIIICNRRARIHQEMNVNGLALEASKQNVRDAIKTLVYGRNVNESKREKGMIEEVFDFVKESFDNIKLDSSAGAQAVISGETKEGVCKIPYKIAKELFRPYFISYLMRASLVPGVKSGMTAVENDRFEHEFEEWINAEALPFRCYVIASGKDGIIKEMTPKISKYNVIELSVDDYIDLDVQLESGVRIFLLPKFVNLQSDQEPISIDKKEQKRFFDFLDQLNKEDLSVNEKEKMIRSWVDEINQDDVANSIAFSLLSGRNLKLKKAD